MSEQHEFTPLLSVIDGAPTRICGVKVDGDRCGKRCEDHVSGNPKSQEIYEMTLGDEAWTELMAERDADLHPDLVPWMEDGEWGQMLRHPLVYMIPMMLPGHANKAYEQKRRLLAEYEAEGNYSGIIWLHERAYRMKALIDYVTGRDDATGEILPLDPTNALAVELTAEVWVDSENIEQVNEDWRSLICQPGDYPTGVWLGTAEERAQFDALPDPIPAWRGGTVGDWSWTTDLSIAEFFTRRSNYAPRYALIPKADCFGYLTRRGESELLVMLTDERYPLVYPNHTIEGA